MIKTYKFSVKSEGKRWYENIKIDLTEIMTVGVIWIHLAQDTDR